MECYRFRLDLVNYTSIPLTHQTINHKPSRQGKKWKLYTGDTTCVCARAEKKTRHTCTLLPNSYITVLWITLVHFNDVGKHCVELLKKRRFDDTTKMMMKGLYIHCASFF